MANKGTADNGFHCDNPAHGDHGNAQENEIHRLVHIGMEHTETGRLQRAEETFRRVLALAQAQGFPQWEAQAWYSLGVVLDRSGKYREAVPLFERGLVLFSERGPIRMEVGCSIFLANMLTKTGDAARAFPILQHALEQAEKGLSTGTLPPDEYAYELYGLYREFGRAYRGKAQFLLAEAQDDLRPKSESERLYEEAQAMYQQAHAMYQQALRLDVLYAGVREESALYQDILNLFLEQGDIEEARTFGEHALKRFDPADDDDRLALAEVLFQLGIICLQACDFANSLRHSLQSYEYFSQGGRSTVARLGDQEADLAFFGRLFVNIGSAYAGLAGSFENIVAALAYWRSGQMLLEQVGAPDVTVPRENIAGLKQVCGEQIGPGAFTSVWEASEPLCQQMLAGTSLQEDAWVNPFPPVTPTNPQPGRSARPGSRGEARQLMKETLAPFHRECARLLRLGQRALNRKNYRLASRHFGAAMEEDVMDETPATFYYAMTCLYLGELTEATEIFGGDRAHREDAVASLLLYEWCQMCRHPTPAAYIEWNRGEFDELEEGEDPLVSLERMAEDHEAESATEVFAAVMQLVRGDGQACLVRLVETESKWGSEPMPWLALFWLGMAYASLGQSERGQSAIEDALAKGMPPLLLSPLRWLDAEKSAFVTPLLLSYDLPYLQTTAE